MVFSPHDTCPHVQICYSNGEQCRHRKKERKMTKQQILVWLAPATRVVLGVMWVVAGATKVGKLGTTTQSIEAYEIFTYEWSRYLAHVIGPVEVLGGAMLVLGVLIPFCSIVSLTALTLFIVGLSQALARGLNIDCGCFGTSDLAGTSLDMWIAILRDIVFIGLTVFVWKCHASRKMSVEGLLTSRA